MGASFVWALVLVHISHGTLIKEHISVYGSEDTCQLARKSWSYYDQGSTMYFCQKELVK